MGANRNMLSVSLFTGAGIGDAGFSAAGARVGVMSELKSDRASLATTNFPEATMIVGDIWDTGERIVEAARQIASERREDIFLLSCTAPCQGMSKNGRGKLLNLIRSGQRPKMDPRNSLILPALEVIVRLRPRWVFFENVSEVAHTMIEDSDRHMRSIPEIIADSLCPEYVGRSYDLEFADFGVPQRRRRLLTIYTRSEEGRSYLRAGGLFVPPSSHSLTPTNGERPWISVTEALADFTPLDARDQESASDRAIPFHRVPLLDSLKYHWVSNTPTSRSAFDNQCDQCGHSENPTHGGVRDAWGIHRSRRNTPVRCRNCGEVLPRPHVLRPDGEPRIMSGYTSAYKRMSPDLPASTLTRNLSCPSSDQKVHPTEHRVLSLAEAFRIHTLDDYEFLWGPMRNNKGDLLPQASDTLIGLAVGESIPPRITELVLRHITDIEAGVPPVPSLVQGSLFNFL